MGFENCEVFGATKMLGWGQLYQYFQQNGGIEVVGLIEMGNRFRPWASRYLMRFYIWHKIIWMFIVRERF